MKASCAMMKFSTRPAHRDDYDFLWRLRVESMSANIREAFGVWDEETTGGRIPS